jgi:hypothetical protein
MAKQKTFTLEEAQTLVPVLRSLIKRAMDDKGVIEAVEKELLDLKHRILLSGGLLVDVPAVARRRAPSATKPFRTSRIPWRKLTPSACR